MKILLTSVPTDEEIHEVKNRLPEIIEEMSPDYVFIVAGESLSIHSPMISELHMFEYSNVRFATWNLIEDILYRIDELPDYYISVYPVNGEYKCKETGYRGVFTGVETPIGYIQYEYTRKIFEKETNQKTSYIIHSNTIKETLFIWEAFKDFISIDKYLRKDIDVSILGKEEVDIGNLLNQPLYIGWRSIKDGNGLNSEEIGIIKLLAYAIDNGFLQIFKDVDIRRKLLDRVEDVTSKLEYIFYGSTSSDREGYELVVTHEKDVGEFFSVSAKITYLLKKLDDMDALELDRVIVQIPPEEVKDAFTHLNVSLLKNEETFMKLIENSDVLDKFNRL